MNNNHPAAVIAGKLMMAKRVLLLTHQRPDGDALGSTFGMQEFLRGNGIDAQVLIPDPLPRRYAGFFSGHLSLIFPGELDGFDLFLALDCANPARLGTGSQITAEEVFSRNFICIDHHRGNSLPAAESWIAPDRGSTCQMVMELIDYLNMPLSSSGATKLLTGMMTDTGCFCFSNTSGSTMRAAALALDYGADVELIANNVFFNKTLNQLEFEADMIENYLKLACGGRFAYACISPELLEKHHFDLREDEGLIDIIRGLEGVIVAMLVHRRDDGWRISLRSKDSRFPVAPVAREFGGGGHELAAGCTIDVPDFAEVEKTMISVFDKILNQLS